MTEKEKMIAGQLYDPHGDDGTLSRELMECKMACHAYNQLAPDALERRGNLLGKLLGSVKDHFLIEQPFVCDYGYNIAIGENFYANHNLVILDPAPVVFGDNVFVGPNCSFYTPIHPLDAKTRNQGLESAKPITVGNNVWFGGSVTVLPGVSIGDNCVIGAGSVVVHDIPSHSLAVGNPCKVIRMVD